MDGTTPGGRTRKGIPQRDKIQKGSISPRRDRSTNQRRSPRQWRGTPHKLPLRLPIERMLGSGDHQSGFVRRTRLDKLQTDETQAGRQIGCGHLGCFASRLNYSALKEIACIPRAPVVLLATALRYGRRRCLGEDSRRDESAILRRRQPEGQEDDNSDAAEKRHAPLGF